MPVGYRVVPKRDLGDLEAKPKHYPVAVCTGRTGARELAERVARLSNVFTADSLGVQEALPVVIPDELAQGRIVDLGELGAFRPTVRASREATAEAAGQYNLLGVQVQQHAGSEVREALTGDIPSLHAV